MTKLMSFDQVGAWLTGAQVVGGFDNTLEIKRVHSDSRSLQAGDLFVALRGERFDANEFLQQARDQGAVAAICQGDSAALKLRQAGLAGWVVPDAKAALAELASRWRGQFQLPLIAVTGSNGKTTVTQMIASILRAWQAEAALATQGNLNNDIGVPLTVLRLHAGHRVAVVELGMNHPGEITTLSAIAQPTVALVNNAQREHLEFMNTVQAVAEENGSVIDALPLDGVAVFPMDDDYTTLWQQKAGQRRTFTFGSRECGAQIWATQAHWAQAAWQVQANTPEGELSYDLHIAGAHNVKNSLAAVACALAAGVPLSAISAGLQAFEPVKGRSRALLLNFKGRELTLVDDTYNANPDSVRAAIDVLAALPGPRLLVLGDMGEVGDQGPKFHLEALQLAHDKNIDKVLVTGQAFGQAALNCPWVQVCEPMAALHAAALKVLPEVTSVLVKGSRFMKMEQVVEVLQAEARQETDAC